MLITRFGICCSDENDEGFVRVYPGKLQLQIEDAFVNVPVDNSATVTDLVRDALNKFGLQDNKIEDYRFAIYLVIKFGFLQ